MKKPVIIILLISTLLFTSAFVESIHAQSPTIQITLYVGEKTSSQYGFGNSSDNLESPGPTLTLHSGDTVKVTLQNVGTMPHNWAIVDAKSSSAIMLWDAQIGSPNNAVPSMQSQSVTFTVGSPGNYYYICQVDDHVALGLWGNVVVEGAIPEFPAPLLLAFLAMAVTATIAYVGRRRTKSVTSLW